MGTKVISIESLQETIRTQQATIDRLTEALRPLANMADHFPTQRKFGNRPTSGNIYECDDSAGCHGITVEDCHTAKALIAKIEAGND